MRLRPILIALLILASCSSAADGNATESAAIESAAPDSTTASSTTTSIATQSEQEPESSPQSSRTDEEQSNTDAPSTTTTTTTAAVGEAAEVAGDSDSPSSTAADAETATADAPATTVHAPASTASASAEPALPTGNLPPSVGAEPATDSPSQFDQLITELSAFVEAERGLEFQRRPQIDLLDEAEFASAWVQLIDEDAAESATDFENFTNIYQVMGIISSNASLAEIWTRFGDAGVLGYYDTESERIVLRSGDVTALTRTTLVHELVHALEDQAFNLDRPSYSEREDEVAWAFSSVIEGSARVIENRYRATFTQAELDEERAALNALPRSVSLSEFNSSFLELQFGRYNYGETFAQALWAQGQDAVDQALLSPPTASELILNPTSFLNGSTADAPVSPPPADGPIFEQGVWGEAAWIALLSDVFSLAESRDIANGWGGDWYVAWNDAADTCVRVDVAADSPAELEQYASGLGRWVEAQPGRELSEPQPGLLRITACG